MNLQIYMQDISHKTDFETVMIKKITKGDLRPGKVVSAKTQSLVNIEGKTYVADVVMQITFEKVKK